MKLFLGVVLALAPLATAAEFGFQGTTLPREFQGEPTLIREMRKGDDYWVAADSIMLDKYNRAWIEGVDEINKKSPHRVLLRRYFEKETGWEEYEVHIKRSRLKGHRGWKRGVKSPQEMKELGFIPVRKISTSD